MQIPVTNNSSKKQKKIKIQLYDNHNVYKSITISHQPATIKQQTIRHTGTRNHTQISQFSCIQAIMSFLTHDIFQQCYKFTKKSEITLQNQIPTVF